MEKTKPDTAKARTHQSKKHTKTLAHTHTHSHSFNGPLSRTTRVCRTQKGKTNLDFTEARDREWQWHQLGHMQVCTLLQTDNHTSIPPLISYRPGALPAAQPAASKHSKQRHKINPKKLKPGLVAFYDIRPGNGAGLFSKKDKSRRR